MKRKTIEIIFLSFVIFNTANAQKKVYQFSDGDKYCAIELDTDSTTTWGTYRASHYFDIPYFDMTFISQIQQTETGESTLVIVPTFYTYSYYSILHGESDYRNQHKQKIKFTFRIEQEGKELHFCPPDSLEREKIINLSSFSKKKIIDITNFPPSFTKSKKPKWKKFNKDIRNSLGKRLRTIRSKPD